MSRLDHNLKRCQERRGAAAFTVTELMVAVSLMTLIVLALYSMFNQTQRALRANESQVDSAERGRGVLELVSREMESTRVGMRADTTNLWLRTALLPIALNDVPGATPIAPNQPALRLNRFDDVYYLTKSERAWRGVGYVVLATTNIGSAEALDRPTAGLGTLYRYETPLTNRNYSFPSTNLFSHWIQNLPTPSNRLWTTNATNFSQVSQGIVHFRVLPYDTKGQLMSIQTTNIDSAYQMIRTSPVGVMKYPLSNVQGAVGNAKDIGLVNVVLSQALSGDPLSTWATYRSNAIPAYLELELGVLEPDALRTYNQMIKDDMGPQAKAYLERRIAKVQIFRKRIPLRTVAQ